MPGFRRFAGPRGPARRLGRDEGCGLIDRVADALGFDLMDDEGYRRGAMTLLRFGYKLPAPLRLLARNPAW
jgi:hypothetical protein